MLKIGCWFLLVMLCLSPICHADTLFLTNGDRITGTVLEMNGNECIFQSQYHAVLHIPRNQISEATITTMMAVILSSGERLKGSLEVQKDGSFQVRSTDLGIVTVAPDKVSKIERYRSEKDPNWSGLAAVRGTGLTETASGTSSNSTPLNTSQSPPRIGIAQEPNEEDIRLLFLRQSSVLLKPGQAEIDLAGLYKSTKREYLGDTFRTREFWLAPTLRYGLFNRAEGFLSLPYEYVHRETVGVGGGTATAFDSGIGDVSGGFKYMLLRESARAPEIVGSISVTAPTGTDPYKNGANPVPLGSGYWALTPSVQFIRSYDPVVLFWGLNYTHQFERHVSGQRIAPGDTFAYNLGMGFAVNQNVSLSAQLSAAYQLETKLNGTTIPGSSQEPVSLRMALTNRLAKNYYLEPSVTFGLNNDAPDFLLGISFVYQFGGK